MHINMPTLLTLIRLVLSPILLPILFVWLLPLNLLVTNILLGVVFVLFSLTDFLDGYLARRRGEVTILGRVLDPIADKFLTYSSLLALLAVHKVPFLVAFILIGRDFFMVGLRLVGLEHKLSIPVSGLAKFKTALQSAYIAVAIANPYQSYTIFSSKINQLEYALLVGTMGLSLFTAWRYYRAFVEAFKAIEE